MATVLEIVSPNTRYTDKYIEADYKYDSTIVKKEKGVLKVLPRTTRLTFRTARHVPKLGVMLVGWGGNNGSTATAAVLANRHHLAWHTKDGIKKPNYFGSLLQAGTTSIGTSEAGDEVHLPFRDLLPTVHPDDLVFGGWDISSADLAQAMERAKVIDYDLQRQLRPLMEGLKPLPAIYDKDFIADNQEDRADNVIRGTKWEQVSQIRRDIRDFRERHQVEKVIVLWTANTERFCELKEGLNDTSAALLSSIKAGQSEISPSTLYAVASILEDCAFINGSPQNTFVPGLVELAEKNNVLVGGDDFKSGQTKFKSVLVDFLVGAGIKPVAIASYNHLGNNDGKNLSSALQFRSKEISKSNVVDDMIASNPVLYAPGEKIDHCVVIKYMPYVGDSKRALDEYTSEIMMNGKNTIVVHNTCEDSFLAVPLILDLVVLTELCQRISFRVLSGHEATTFQPFNSILSILSYLCKAPLVPRGAPVINALNTQRCCIENLFRGCLGLPPVNHLGLEHKLSNPKVWCTEQQEQVRDSGVLLHQEQLNGFVKGKAVIVEGFECNGVENGYH